MSEATELQEEDTQIEVQEDTTDYKSLYEKTKADLEAVAKKKEELLTETKQAKQAKREADDAVNKAAQDKAAKDGEFEKLWQLAQKEKEELNKRLQEVTTSNRKEKIQVAAMRIATDLADGDNAELLSDFVSRSLDKMADETGLITSDVVEAVTNDYKANLKFKALLRGSKAVGGGATGNTSSAQTSKAISRDAFDKLDLMSKQRHIKSGGSIADSL